ncbi:MAG: methyltransferase domain-containing protein, partial [Alphaproteobacteria bacterium]|nr:methyltransferase domain-containing protein [Alphaproteobacteria bacterium]
MTVGESSRRFQDTVADYQAYRLDYPPRLIARLAALLDLKAGDAMLDLGCGPGNLALAFARRGLAVTAMDPEPAMLDAARAAAAAEGLRINFSQRGSADLTPADGPFRLVAIGRAFHWMDRAATLATLNRIVTPDGGVALFHDAHPPVEENAWYRVFNKLREKYGRAGLAHVSERGEGGHRRYEPYLFASAFTRIDGLSVTIRHALTEDAIVGRAFSTSIMSR